MKKLIEVKKVNGRYFHTWDEDENCCIHGIKARWVCDDCADESEEAQPETAGSTLAGVAPTTSAMDAIVLCNEGIAKARMSNSFEWEDLFNKLKKVVLTQQHQ